MQEDELELDTLGDRKTALFVIISDTDDTFNFVVSICTHSYLTYFVIKPMMFTVEDYLFM